MIITQVKDQIGHELCVYRGDFLFYRHFFSEITFKLIISSK